MVLGLSAFSATFGLVVIFFVIFPALVQGLLGIAVFTAIGEKADNDAYAAAGRTDGADDGRAA